MKKEDTLKNRIEERYPNIRNSWSWEKAYGEPTQPWIYVPVGMFIGLWIIIILIAIF